jgi:hypothetical protein
MTISDAEKWKKFDLLLAHFQAIGKSQSFFVNTLSTFLIAVWAIDLLHHAGGITIQMLGASIQIDGLWEIVPLVAGVLSLGLIGSINLILPAWRRLDLHLTEFFSNSSFFFTEFDPHRNILDYIAYLTLSLTKPVLPEVAVGLDEGKQKWAPSGLLYPALILFSIFTTSFTLRRVGVRWASVLYVFSSTIAQAVFCLPFVWRKVCLFTGVHKDGYAGIEWRSRRRSSS